MVRSKQQRGKRAVTAVEIDGRFLRAVELRGRGPETSVIRWAGVELERLPDLDDEGSLQEAGLILDGLLSQNRFSRNQIAVVLPSNIAVTKALRLPSHNKQELSEMARNELAGQGIFDGERHVAWDVVIRERVAEGYADVEITQIRERDVALFLAVLTAARLRPSHVVLSSEALAGLCSLLKGDDPGIILRAAASGIDVLSRSVGETQARRIPLVEGEDGAVRLRELDRTLTTLRGRGEERNGAPAGVLAAHGTPVRVEEAPSLQGQGNVKPLSWEDLNGVAPRGIEESSLGDFALCLGAAVRVLSPEPLPYLLPRRLLFDRARTRRRRWRGTLAFVCLVDLGLLGAVLWQDWSTCKQELEALRAEIERAAPIVESLETKREVLKATEALAKARTAPLDFFYAIHAVTPQPISLSAASLAGDRFTIRGDASRLSMVFEYVGVLQDTSGFGGVEVQETGMKRRGEKEVAEFSLRGTFTSPGPIKVSGSATP